MALTPEDILDFWLRDVGRERWFSDDASFDTTMRERFGDLYDKAACENLPQWKKTPEGMLSLVLLLQEFPRRMFRGTAQAYATDDLALYLAREAIVQHFDDRIDKTYKLIFYLPYMYSENEADQRLALFYIRERTKDNDWLVMAERNTDTIERFGRFPDRNTILGRDPTAEEMKFLQK
jgi:uncharacterized protein (DUF924 family)